MSNRTIWAALFAFAVTIGSAQADIDLKAGDGQQWFKGQTHTHTLWSDGDAAPEVAIDWFASRDYNFIALSEHNVLPVGERWVAYGEGRVVTPEHVKEIKKAFGEDWADTRDRGGRTEMRLKTYEELKDYFERPGEFLLVWGEEITSSSPPVHVNGLNLRDQVRPATGGSKAFALRKNVGAVQEQSKKLDVPMIAYLNHPNWNVGVSAEDILQAGNVAFFEVYNGHGGVYNWGRPDRNLVPTDQLWDIVLSIQLKNGGPTFYGVATDDSHNYHEMRVGASNPGRGWCMVLADELAPEKLVEAFKEGRYYASSGVSLDEIYADDDVYRVTIQEEAGVTYTTQFIGTPKDFDPSSEPQVDEDGEPIPDATGRYSDEIGQVLFETTDNPAVYEYNGDELYVRAKIVSSKPHPNPHQEGDTEMAWTQPDIR